jgi:formylglycine-generating enzyme required for sulfatase activity
MLASEWEWVQDSTRRSLRERRGLFSDIIDIYEYIKEKNPRILLGGAFYKLPANVRSASRNWVAPANRSNGYGFRPSRTYP